MIHPMDFGEAAAPAASRTIPFDYLFSFELRGEPGRVVDRTVSVSIEAPFTAVSVGYGIVPRAPVPFGPAREADFGDVALVALPPPGPLRVALVQKLVEEFDTILNEGDAPAADPGTAAIAPFLARCTEAKGKAVTCAQDALEISATLKALEQNLTNALRALTPAAGSSFSSVVTDVSSLLPTLRALADQLTKDAPSLPTLAENHRTMLNDLKGKMDSFCSDLDDVVRNLEPATSPSTALSAELREYVEQLKATLEASAKATPKSEAAPRRVDQVTLGSLMGALQRALEGRADAGRDRSDVTEVLTTGIRLNPELATLLDGAGTDRELKPELLGKLFEEIRPTPEHVRFLYALYDQGTGREFQNEPILSTASLGIADGDRPFRQFAVPITFTPRSTIRISITELTPFAGELHVALHGYRTLGGAASPAPQQIRRASARAWR